MRVTRAVTSYIGLHAWPTDVPDAAPQNSSTAQRQKVFQALADCLITLYAKNRGAL
jgi:hypothetical protein